MSAGLCQCGCGSHAPRARKTNARYGIVAGDALRFIRGHERRVERSPDGQRARVWVVTEKGRAELARIQAERTAA